jgi:transposase-like protein
MGTGKEYVCKHCGATWVQMTGIGMKSSPEEVEQELKHPGTVNNPEPVCPDCGSKEYYETGAVCHWD